MLLLTIAAPPPGPWISPVRRDYFILLLLLVKTRFFFLRCLCVFNAPGHKMVACGSRRGWEGSGWRRKQGLWDRDWAFMMAAAVHMQEVAVFLWSTPRHTAIAAFFPFAPLMKGASSTSAAGCGASFPETQSRSRGILCHFSLSLDHDHFLP